LTNIDDLFDREELSAAPDVGWPDCFNSGVFVFRPSNDTYASLLQFALTTGSFDGTHHTSVYKYSRLTTKQAEGTATDLHQKLEPLDGGQFISTSSEALWVML